MVKKSNKQPVVSYEPEADVLSWELNNKAIDHAEEAGNVVVHFSKDQQLVLVEILNAKQFFLRGTKAMTARRPSARVAIAA